MPDRQSSTAMAPEKAIEVFKRLITEAAELERESFGSPRRDEWTDTAEAALQRAFASGSSVLQSFVRAKSIVFKAKDSEENLRKAANDQLSSQVAVLRSAISQQEWQLSNGDPVENSLAALRQRAKHEALNEGPVKSMNKRAFISHISEEADVAKALKVVLVRDFLGLLTVFVSSDTESIAAGEEWLRSVEQALENCAMQIILCSPDSITRPWINFEAGAAWIRKIPLIPICHSGLTPRDLPMPLSLRQAISLDDPQGLRVC